ncbi:MAG: DUF4162 domain-containing protein, partial [Actinomycetota bacterium]
TQYMEEADRLCDNIVVIDRGKKIAEGNADRLKAQVGGERVEIVVENAADLPMAESCLAVTADEEVVVDEPTRTVTAAVSGGVYVLDQVLQRLKDKGISVMDIGVRRPTLDDVFLSLTGHVAEEIDEDGESGDGSSPQDKEIREKEAVR